MMHDHHCQCDRCCIARHVSRSVQKNPPWRIVIGVSLIFWASIAAMIAGIVRCVNG